MTWPFPGIPSGVFRVIYADFAWTFETYSAKGAKKAPQAHYDTMSIAEIAALPIGALAARDCALAIWIYDPLLPEILRLIEGWGFEFKTVLRVWRKTTGVAECPQCGGGRPVFGKGYYSRHGGEQLWLATCGAPKVRCHSIRQFFDAPLREHSRKPDQVRVDLERMFDGPYVEIGARSRRRGWAAVLSNELGKFD